METFPFVSNGNVSKNEGFVLLALQTLLAITCSVLFESLFASVLYDVISIISPSGDASGILLLPDVVVTILLGILLVVTS